ncbi:hypothetical protein GIB67_004460 [Kingdonia uniflora]|nr:hypothetical protein GIB67_004460 [Kingdonia uniflora]
MKISEMGKDILEKQNVSEKEVSELRQLVDDYDIKLKSLETKMDSQRPLLFEQLNCISRIHDQIYDVIKIVSDDGQSEFSDSLFLPQEMDMDVNLRVSVAAMESIYDLVKTIKEKVRDGFEEKNRETKRSNEIIDQLVKEKQHIGSLLRSALPRQMTLDPTSKTNEVLQVAENGLRKAGINVKLTNILENGENMSSIEKQGSKDSGEDEVYSLAGALENIVKASQVEIIELRHSVEELRVESDLLKGHVEAQAKELAQRKHRIEELEEKERMAEDSIEGLMMDIAAAEEDITRWKLAAEQEAAAGRAVEQDYKVQLSALAKELDEAKQAMVESEKKLKYKEETASAAMAARDAAEKSLRLADLRSSRLSERLEELSRQVEESDPRGDSRLRDRQRYACWPWQLLGINFIRSANQTEAQQQNSNEMELSEPLL